MENVKNTEKNIDFSVIGVDKAIFVGGQLLKGKYSFTNRNTGELIEGEHDEWLLRFVVPSNPFANYAAETVGCSIVEEKIKTSDKLCYLFGKDPVTFNASAELNSLVGAVVALSYVKNGSVSQLRCITKV